MSPATRSIAAVVVLLSILLLSQTEEIALEIKTFDAHDGQGLTLAHSAGLRTGCITGRQSSALLRRAREMNLEFIYMKQPLKMPAYEEILQKAGVPDACVAYVGNDLPDLPVMRRAGLAVAAGNAVPEVKERAHYVTKALAGHGAIRETVELLLKSKGIWGSDDRQSARLKGVKGSSHSAPVTRNGSKLLLDGIRSHSASIQIRDETAMTLGTGRLCQNPFCLDLRSFA